MLRKKLGKDTQAAKPQPTTTNTNPKPVVAKPTGPTNISAAKISQAFIAKERKYTSMQGRRRRRKR